MKKIRGLIFDMDGTLLDTEKIYFQCWLQSAKAVSYTHLTLPTNRLV